MVAKKYPPQKMATRKAPVKKAVAAKKSTPMKSAVSRSAAIKKATAATSRAERKSPPKPKKKVDPIDVSYSSYDTGYKKIKKAGQDARGRATKYGKPVGRTNVYGMDQGSRSSSRLMGLSGPDKHTSAFTTVKSGPYGATYVVEENKMQRKFARDKDRRTSVTPTDKTTYIYERMRAAQKAREKAARVTKGQKGKGK